MPSIHYLNPPPHPFFDFVANLEDHPFFAAYGPQNLPFRRNGNPNQQAPPQQEQGQEPAEKSEKATEKQPTVEDDTEDPPEVDPATLNAEQTREESRGMPFCRGGHCGRGRGRDHASPSGFGPHHGPHPHGPAGFGPHHGPHAHGPPRGPWWARGPASPWHGPHHGPSHRHHGPGSCSPGRRGMRDGPSGFNLAEFLNNLGNRLGIDLSGAAEGLGLERFNVPQSNSDVDFEPRVDVFDTPVDYTVHLSLPGAKKEDVGVDWDGENSILRIAGVVHRPGADEELLKHLAVDGRKREVGVFEKSVRLGTKRDPAAIDVAGISAKMTDGVLVVKVPKVEVEHQKREVPITSSSSSSPSPPQAPEKDVDMEKGVLLDADNTDDTTPVLRATPLSAGAKEKDAEHQREVEMRDARSETMDFDHDEKLPEYQVEEPEHAASDEEEGEYVKINVD